jgi:hypothetical protein
MEDNNKISLEDLLHSDPAFQRTRVEPKAGQFPEVSLEDLLNDEPPFRKPAEQFLQRQLTERDAHNRLVKQWELEETKESNRAKRLNYRIILLAALGGGAVPVVLSAMIYSEKVTASDSQKSQSFTASVGIVTSILGFLAGYSAP